MCKPGGELLPKEATKNSPFQMVLLNRFALQKYDNNSVLTTASGENIDWLDDCPMQRTNKQRIANQKTKNKVD